MPYKRFLFVTAIAITLSLDAAAQMSRKPTPTRAPKIVTQAGASANKNSIPAVPSRPAFDSIARVYHKGTPYAMPHALFVIDRRSNNRVYFVNSNRYRFHKDFLLANYLVPRGSDVFKPIYIDQDRRFIVGTIAWQQAVEKFTWELWEGDLASKELIKTANTAINKNFFDKVLYKPNSIRQEDATSNIGVERILQDELNRNQAYLALNTGKGTGRLHIIDKLDDTVEIGDATTHHVEAALNNQRTLPSLSRLSPSARETALACTLPDLRRRTRQPCRTACRTLIRVDHRPCARLQRARGGSRAGCPRRSRTGTSLTSERRSRPSLRRCPACLTC